MQIAALFRLDGRTAIAPAAPAGSAAPFLGRCMARANVMIASRRLRKLLRGTGSELREEGLVCLALQTWPTTIPFASWRRPVPKVRGN